MEFIKQNKLLVVGGALALVLLLVAATFLFINLRQYSADTSAADENQNRLAQLENRQPGPTAANVQLVASNAVLLEKSLKTLQSELRRDQVEPVNKPRSVFNSFLKSTINQMNKAAEQHRMLVPARFDYGFKTYVEGQLPATGEVARLTVQVQMVKGLVDVLLQARVAEVVSIERQIFEAGAVSAVAAGTPEGRGGEGRGGDVPAAAPGTAVYPLEPPDAQGLYTREHFTLTLRMTDERLAALMNLLTRDVHSGPQRMFVTVSRVSLVGVGLPKAGVTEAEPAVRTEGRGAATAAPTPAAETPPPAEGAIPEKPAPPKQREDRIVAGRDHVTVQLDVDVYRFAAAAAREKGQP
jgi:hypothetical protein